MFQIYARPDHQKIVSQILKDWDKLKLPQADKSKLKIKLLPYRRAGLHSLLNSMIFSENQLLLVIKMPRYKDGNLAFAALKNEAHMLEHLNKKNILKGHIPQIYKLLYVEDVPALLIRAYQGEMLHHFLDKEEDLTKLDQYISSGAELLPNLYNKKESSKNSIDDAFIQKYIKEPLKLVAEYYPQQIIKIEETINTFLKNNNYLGKKYPDVYLHREFNPWNILREPNGNLIVLDWEDAQIKGLPFLDIYNYFIICFRIIFFGESAHSKNRSPEQKKKRVDVLLKNYSNFINNYCKTLNISADLRDLFYIIFAINITNFFAEEKRREIDYGKSWLALLLSAQAPNCFENHINIICK